MSLSLSPSVSVSGDQGSERGNECNACLSVCLRVTIGDSSTLHADEDGSLHLSIIRPCSRACAL